MGKDSTGEEDLVRKPYLEFNMCKVQVCNLFKWICLVCACIIYECTYITYIFYIALSKMLNLVLNAFLHTYMNTMQHKNNKNAKSYSFFSNPLPLYDVMRF